MRILIAWELGENYGHLLRQLPVIKNLRARGHDVLFAVKNIVTAQQTLSAEGIPFIQAPRPHGKSTLDREIANFSDILFCSGFSDRDALHALVNTWHQVYRLYVPDVVVIDHSPAAAFAARLLDIPVAEITMGFESPPASSPYPCFRPWLNLPQDIFLQNEAAILANLNSVCDQHQHPRFEQLYNFTESDVQFLVTFPELDHYRGRKNAQYLGPLFTFSDGVSATWPSVHRQNVFVYVRASTALTSILHALSQSDINIICVAPGLDPAVKAQYQTASFHIYETHVKLAPLLSQCDLAVTYSGYGMISACLLAGIPMLTIPTQIEQMMISNCVTRSGMGLSLTLADVPEHFQPTLMKLLADPGYTDRAHALAEKYKAFDHGKLVDHIVNTIESLPAIKRKKSGTMSTIAVPISSTLSHTNLRSPTSKHEQKRIALITGASRGIGAAIAKRLAKENLLVIVNYKHNHDAARVLVEHITSLGGTAHAMQADMYDTTQLGQVFANIREQFGRLDVLVNNVGTARLMPIARVDAVAVQQLLVSNIQTVLLACKEAAGLFTASGGRIINISSITSHAGPPGSALYGASKAAIEGITTTLAIELGAKKVTVNAIAPGQIDTDLYRKMTSPDFNRYVLSRTPLGRLGLPEDVAAAAAFFASAEAHWITGQVMRVDGGFSY